MNEKKKYLSEVEQEITTLKFLYTDQKNRYTASNEAFLKLVNESTGKYKAETTDSELNQACNKLTGIKINNQTFYSLALKNLARIKPLLAGKLKEREMIKQAIAINEMQLKEMEERLKKLK